MGFGYAINYDEAITRDKHRIEVLTHCIENRLFVSELNAETIDLMARVEAEGIDLTTSEIEAWEQTHPWIGDAWAYFTRNGVIDEGILLFMPSLQSAEPLNDWVYSQQRVWGLLPNITVNTPREGYSKRLARRYRLGRGFSSIDIDTAFPNDEASAKADLKRAKAALSRHKRNRKKYA